MPPSSPRRRAFLAACGTAMAAGCSDILAIGSTPPIDCAPGDYTWPMYAYDPARTSHVASRDLPSADAETRRFTQTGSQTQGGGSIQAPPVIADGVVYSAGDVRIEARDVETGERLWETDPDDSIATSPALTCGTLYVCTLNQTLALDPEDGTSLWDADTGSHSDVSASPVAVDDTLFVIGSDVTALNAETGDERWSERPDHIAQGIAVSDRVYVGAGSNGGGEVVAYTRSGDVWWRTAEPGEVYSAPAVANDIVYAVSKTGTMTALAATDGSIEWQVDVESGVFEPPSIAEGRVVVEAGNGTRTMAFDAWSGDRLWTFETGVSSGAPTIVGDYVLATGANTGVHVLDAETGERVRHWAAESVGSQPVCIDGKVFYRGWNVSDVFVIE